MSSTSKKQRIAIWAILILMVVSTAALYIGVVVTQQNTTSDTREQEKQYKEYQKIYDVYSKKMEAQANELSAKYFNDFKQYETAPKAFNAANVKELKIEDIKIGEGGEIDDKSTQFVAYYIGWKPDGNVFDGSFKDGKLTNPFVVKKEKSSDKWSVIDGWSEGVKGMKIGGIRELTIPAEKAYGAAGSSNPQDASKSIGANTPLKFIIMLIPKIEEIPEPDYSSLGL